LVTGLEPNQQYYFWVFPIDRNGQPQLNMLATASRTAATTFDCANCLIKVRRDQVRTDPKYNDFVPQAGKNMVDEACEMFGANDSLLSCAKIFDPNPKFTYQGVGGNGFNGWGSEAWINPNPGILQLIPDLNRIFVTFDSPKKIRSLYIQDWFGNGRVTIEYKDCFCKEWKVFKVVELEGVAPGKWIIDTELPPVTVKEFRFSRAKSDAVMRQFYFCGEDAECGTKPGKVKARGTALNPVTVTEIRSHSAALTWAADMADEEAEQPVFVQQYEGKIGTAYNPAGELVNPRVLKIKALPTDPLAIVRLDDLAPATTYFTEIRPLVLADPCETHTATPGVKKSMFRTDSVTVRKRKETAQRNEQALFTLKMAPNPANNFVNISLSDGIAAQIAVYSTDGRLLLGKSVSQPDDLNLDIRHLPAGAYWVRVQRTDGAVRTAFLGKVN
jgi:Secretion system C-terminal sorting domain